ncbi:MAG TPA: hypothetical protein VGK73_27165 [Polyangiaceae bacterium]
MTPAPPPPEGVAFGGPPPSDAGSLPKQPKIVEIAFEKQPGWAAGLDVFGGLAALAGSDTRGSFAYGGVLARGRYRYYEIGGYFQLTDDPLSSAGSFQEFGGILGAWLPFQNWVDFELAARIGARTYEDPSTRYGASGYELTGATLGFQFGVSDRVRSDLVGGRVGAQIVGSYDLKQRDQPWQETRIDANGMEVLTSGTTHVGGFTIGIQMSLGLDIGRGP